MTKTQICNLALSWLGSKLVTDVDKDTTTQAQLCAANYPLSRDATLEDGRWTFATKRALLVPLVDTPVWGFEAAFQLPSDCLNVLTAREDDEERTDNTLDWQREGDQIVCGGVSSLRIKYIARVEEESRFPPMFMHALAARMAADLSVTLTGSREMQADMWQLYERKMANAVTSDGLQGRSQRIRANTLKNVRSVNYRGS